VHAFVFKGELFVASFRGWGENAAHASTCIESNRSWASKSAAASVSSDTAIPRLRDRGCNVEQAWHRSRPAIAPVREIV